MNTTVDFFENESNLMHNFRHQLNIILFQISVLTFNVFANAIDVRIFIFEAESNLT